MSNDLKMPAIKVTKDNFLAILQSKIFEHEVRFMAYEEILVTHDFSKGNPTREQLQALLEEKVQAIVKRTEEIADNKILQAKPAPLIIPK